MKKTLELTEQELNVVLFGLQKLPYETSASVIQAIVAQLQAQQIAPKEEVKE